MLCGYEISLIVKCLFGHAIFALLCSLPVLVSWWILTTYSDTFQDMLADSYIQPLMYVGLYILLLGVSFCSHVFADINCLGF